MENIDKKGFVFIDDSNMPYWVAKYFGRVMLFYWHRNQKSWVTSREVKETELRQMRTRAIDKKDAEVYHKLHWEFAGDGNF